MSLRDHMDEATVERLRAICLEFATQEQVVGLVARHDRLGAQALETYLREEVAALVFIGVQALQLSVLVAYELCVDSERRLARARAKLKLKKLFGPYVSAK
jgi:hypothetical protein